ncbi:hypothetical protein B9Z65_2671 [Elsinoe australis]|uniref:Uncharacterized protein n=1 Tax=Elsinoe australis TaxID=40998 RepID=A0A2P8A487_9PEZI|nr:hypothetical protein B9Z65_2671 [Elsinoe australis]
MSRKRSRDESATPRRRGKSPRRVSTVYDAVAGRVGYESFLSGTRVPKTRDTKSSSSQAVYPEEVLFRRKGAPLRYEETDQYFANERLDPERQKLPNSDLLKAIHKYASEYYLRATPLRGKWDFRSMDETALLAMGILLEETIVAAVGDTGDLPFIEGEDADKGIKGPALWDGRQYRRSVLRKAPTGPRGPRRPRSTTSRDDSRPSSHGGHV